MISFNYLNNASCKNFKFHSNLSIPNNTMKYLPWYHKDSIDFWCKYYSCPLKGPSLVFFAVSIVQFTYQNWSGCLWQGLCLSHVNNISHENRGLKSWHKVLNDFQLTEKSYFKWFQPIHAIPEWWKIAILNVNKPQFT